MVGQTRFAVGLFFSSLSTGPGVVFRFPLKAVLCYALSFFYEFIFDEMISGAKAYKVQLGGDSRTGDGNLQKMLQRLDTNILICIFCQNMWNNLTILKDDMSKNSISGPCLFKTWFNYYILTTLNLLIPIQLICSFDLLILDHIISSILIICISYHKSVTLDFSSNTQQVSSCTSQHHNITIISPLVY